MKWKIEDLYELSILKEHEKQEVLNEYKDGSHFLLFYHRLFIYPLIFIFWIYLYQVLFILPKYWVLLFGSIISTIFFRLITVNFIGKKVLRDIIRELKEKDISIEHRTNYFITDRAKLAFFIIFLLTIIICFFL